MKHQEFFLLQITIIYQNGATDDAARRFCRRPRPGPGRRRPPSQVAQGTERQPRPAQRPAPTQPGTVTAQYMMQPADLTRHSLSGKT